MYVAVEGERITGVYKERDFIDHGSSECPNFLHAHLITPGFVDIHTHGVGMDWDWEQCQAKMILKN